jgi:hypothetical protein
MGSDFLIWRYKPVPGAAVLSDFRGFEDTHLFRQQEPLAGQFPADATFHMDPEAPDRLRLPDNVRNTLRVALVSARLRQAMVDFGVQDIEYLPVRIINHKNRLASDSHVIARATHLVDAIDRGQSVFEPHPFLKGRLDAVEKLVIDAARVPTHKSMFRLVDYPEIIVVTARLAAALNAVGMTGLKWLPLHEYRE